MESRALDHLLKGSGLPALGETLRGLARMSGSVVVTYELGGVSEDSKLLDVLGNASGLSRGRVKLVRGRVPGSPQLPRPAAMIGGRLGDRFRVYGPPEDVLEAVFYESLLVASGDADPPEALSLPLELPDRIVARLYLVPGTLCARAWRSLLSLTAACESIAVEVVDVRLYVKSAGTLPVESVPTTVLRAGSREVKLTGAPSAGELARVMMRRLGGAGQPPNGP